MSNLWFFGDSYSIEVPHEGHEYWDYDNNWMSYIAQDLPIEQTFISSQYGVSNDFIFKSFIEHTSQYQSNDCVIVQLTGKSRKWFFENEPHWSNIFNSFGFPPDQQNAIEYYQRYLHNDQLDNIQYTAYVYAITCVIQARPDVKFLILPGFDAVPNVNGTLTTDVCNKELKDPSKFYEKYNGQDPRLNHMSQENHRILADKLVDYFTNGTLLDLTTDFIGNLHE